MRTKLLRGIAAGALAVTLGLVGTAQPAAAEPPQAARGAVSALAFDWVSAIVAVAGAALNSGGSSSSLDAAVRQIIAAVEASEQNILNQIDQLASAEVKACARTHTIEFSDIESMSRTVLQLWAQSATSCAAMANEYVGAVQTKAHVDAIGFAITQISAIAIAARAKAGLINGIDLLVRDQIRSYETLVTKLQPSCDERRWTEYDDRGRPVVTEIHYTCTAYNGDVATDYEQYYLLTMVHGPLNRAAVDADATRNTSRRVAMDALPQLRTLPV
ncbi:hypothetical protein [Pseudosporangium ferrugineum]|uniref:Uncharacterized protein n=1 Tax=Pseudosporangium ferrugineum TaxID=439699 RepID=A0A2T0S3P8_9ACTN|nr:hypothetical protein [Pseudosporangium ferrugineum]PRY28056.1 hypothetical protein CLV70_109212 [Pseudosporangium ferrugineum]